MRPILVQPHSDDAVLFACWTLLRVKPLVVTVFDGHVQQMRGLPITPKMRRDEDKAAMEILGLPEPIYLGFTDDSEPSDGAIFNRLCQCVRGLSDQDLYIPMEESGGHAQHNLVWLACECLPHTKAYLTYTTRGKSTSANEVPFEPEWIGLKLRALACFESQWLPAAGCAEHFIGRSLREYLL